MTATPTRNPGIEDTSAGVLAVPRRSLGQRALSGGTVLALVALVLFFFAMRPDVFLTFTNVRNILYQVSILAIIAVAQTVVMVVGDFDLSVAATSSLSGSVAGALLTAGQSVTVAVLAAVAVGLAIGLVNGLLVAYLNLSAFVATLASMTSIVGAAYLVTQGTTLFNFPAGFTQLGQGRLLNIPMPVYLAVLIALVAWAVLRFTTIGRSWYAIGGNVEVARLSGISVRRSRLLAFTVAGLVAGIGGILLAARLGSSSAVQGSDNLMFSVAAVFLGMTVIRSGAANLGGTVIGVAIIGVMSNGLNILGVNSYVQQVVTGIIIIAAVTLSSLKTRSR
ncbi:ribose transport system permease protein [Quadrisphaera granulorum]|uniref:Ribose transport system permease protein n=1 Tax=Quadrisphaera granulorum TaxID=317664 RepID=A0A316AAH3_9ACTN|nr:ABC transporter permease [Quadrisphaera granulorum]PWJ54399.1 ribose transport system permease protein [Quadrisphaera granulorum]SZE96171.1 ribose transport system permease protein [Quadrisphaera granulorum]